MQKAREAELERQVQDLNAALVVTRNRLSGTSTLANARTDALGASTDTAYRARVEVLQTDLETANAHLALERERVSCCSMRNIAYSSPVSC